MVDFLLFLYVTSSYNVHPSWLPCLLAAASLPTPTPAPENLIRLTLVSFSFSDAHQLQRHSFQCIWTPSLELPADGPQTAGLVIRPFQTVTKDECSWAVGPQRSVHLFNCALEIVSLIAYLQYAGNHKKSLVIQLRKASFHSLTGRVLQHGETGLPFRW